MAVLFSDPSHKEWTMWDYRLLKAYHILQDWYRDGIPIWWDESERVAFNAEARVSKSRAAVERAQDKNSKKSVPGRYFVAKPVVIGGGDFPTRAEWLEEQSKKTSGNTVTKFGTSDGGKNILQGRK